MTPDLTLVIAIAALIATCFAVLTALKGWQDWLALSLQACAWLALLVVAPAG